MVPQLPEVGDLVPLTLFPFFPFWVSVLCASLGRPSRYGCEVTSVYSQWAKKIIAFLCGFYLASAMPRRSCCFEVDSIISLEYKKKHGRFAAKREAQEMENVSGAQAPTAFLGSLVRLGPGLLLLVSFNM